MPKAGQIKAGQGKYGSGTSTLSQLIQGGKIRPIRRCYIKRRDTAGDYEADWIRIDIRQGIDRIVNWGSISIEIDEEDGIIGSFNISNLQMTFNNRDGLFNSEGDSRSLWSGFLNRKYTKLKIEVGYLDEKDNIIGMANIFEGIINKVKIGDDQKAKVSILNYLSILTKYDISDLSLSGDTTINALVTSIMNQSKITEFIPFTTPSAGENITLEDTKIQELTGTYWNNLKLFARLSNSVPKIVGATFSFIERTVGASSVFDFEGHTAGQQDDIYNIKNYDDEGTEKVRVHWRATEGNIEKISTDATLLLKYLGEPELIDLTDFKTNADRQAVVDALVVEWQNPKPLIEFETKFFINEIEPLDKITIEVLPQVIPANAGIYNSNLYDDGSVYGAQLGSVITDAADTWKVIRVGKDIQNFTHDIKAEKVPA